MAPAARGDGQASFTIYMAEERWRALRREADDCDVTRSSILEALYAAHQTSPPAAQAAIIEQAELITGSRRRRADG